MRSRSGIPFGELDALAAPIRRTTVVRLVLGAALVALLALAFALALDEDVRAAAFFPPDRSGVIVIDMSASVTPQTYRRIGRALSRVAQADEPVGVVVFSDAAYELVPPGTPGRELKPLLRYFTPLPGGQRFPVNPWQAAAFQGGTRISEGLRVAHAVLQRDEIREATVLLMSDLEAPQSDRLRIVDAVTNLQNDGVQVRIVHLFAQPQNRDFFARLVGRDGFVAETSLVRPIESDELGLGGRMPWLFLALGGLLACVLAANERLCGRLSVPWRLP